VKVQHYWLEVNALTQRLQIREVKAQYRTLQEGE
jgi:hypothetical protein